jgi:hypothetical protein
MMSDAEFILFLKLVFVATIAFFGGYWLRGER